MQSSDDEHRAMGQTPTQPLEPKTFINSNYPLKHGRPPMSPGRQPPPVPPVDQIQPYNIEHNCHCTHNQQQLDPLNPIGGSGIHQIQPAMTTPSSGNLSAPNTEFGQPNSNQHEDNNFDMGLITTAVQQPRRHHQQQRSTYQMSRHPHHRSVKQAITVSPNRYQSMTTHFIQQQQHHQQQQQQHNLCASNNSRDIVPQSPIKTMCHGEHHDQQHHHNRCEPLNIHSGRIVSNTDENNPSGSEESCGRNYSNQQK